jgi:hypothetical protein
MPRFPAKAVVRLEGHRRRPGQPSLASRRRAYSTRCPSLGARRLGGDGMQRQDGELDLPWPSAQPAAQSCCRSRLPPATCPAPPAVPASATEPLTPADLIPGYLGTDTARASPQFGLDRAAQRCQRGGHVVAHPGHAHASLALRVADRDVGNGEPIHGNAELKVRDTSDDNHAAGASGLVAAVMSRSQVVPSHVRYWLVVQPRVSRMSR